MHNVLRNPFDADDTDLLVSPRVPAELENIVSRWKGLAALKARVRRIPGTGGGCACGLNLNLLILNINI